MYKPELLELQDVRLVEGLWGNMIKIGQLCDQGYLVNFSKDKCEVLDKEKNIIMRGTWLSAIVITGF